MSNPISFDAIADNLSSITLDYVADQGLDNAKANLEDIRMGSSILDLCNGSLAGPGDALIIAGGPSLHRPGLADEIKAFKGVVVAPDCAISWCLRHGIVPHMTVTLDGHPTRVVRWFGDPSLSQDKINADDYFARQEFDPWLGTRQIETNRQLIDMVDGHAKDMVVALSSSSSRSVVDRLQGAGLGIYWWNPYYDDYDLPESRTRALNKMNGLPCINAGGNVSTAAWVLTHAVLGKTRIGLVGMDFCYDVGHDLRLTQCYPSMVALVGADQVHTLFRQVHNPHTGRDYLVDPTYLWYRRVFLEMAQEARSEGTLTYNCTGGALFGDGVESVSLDDFISGK